jgi:hypothetical protein
MMKIGPKATFLNMGGCIEAMENGCIAGVPPECDDYRVDLGAHWEVSILELVCGSVVPKPPPLPGLTRSFSPSVSSLRRK